MSGPEISQDRRVLLKFAKFKSAKEPLKPGDWVYVKGHSDYDSKEMDKALGPGVGPWRGENAVYNGNGSFSGLGLDNLTEQEMKEELLKGYNKKVDAYNKTKYGQSYLKSHGNLSDVQGINPNMILEPDIDAITKAAGGCP